MRRLVVAALVMCAMLAHGESVMASDVSQMQRKDDSGDARAAFHLGRLYRNGIGVAADSKRAFQLIESAALKRHPPAMLILSNMLASGEAGRADQAAARSWLEGAADLDYPEALQQLALVLHAGAMGYSADPVRSALLFRKAAHAMKHRH